MKQSKKSYQRIVVKVGSSLFCPDGIKPDAKILHAITEQIVQLVREAKEVVIVSSGAIAFGIHLLHLKERPRELYQLQATSAIGQNALMSEYRKFFEAKSIRSAQILLTWDDFDDRIRFLNAKKTIEELFRYNCVPIVNENDTVSTDEIKFGDNDRLSALVSSLISADILIILSDVEGLLDKNKKVIRVVDRITPAIKELVCPTKKKTCVGGMTSKIEAAKIATEKGIPTVIANGRTKEIILSVIKEPEKFGTLFLPQKGLQARAHWIIYGTNPKGKIIVDAGAKKALLNRCSLLAVGVVDAQGYFESGDIVSISDKQNQEFARGKTRIASKQLDKIKGSRYHKEIIHCDHIVILKQA